MSVSSIQSFAAGLGYVDTGYLGNPRRIACGVLRTDEGLLLVDPGPTVALDTLAARLEPWGGLEAVAGVLLTHIHLDHAGATGALVERKPDVDVYVHERGARHMIDPTRLLRSAGRLYGDAMDRLWGAVIPVPEARVRVLRGGERLAPGGRTLRVVYTPGHAQHHVSYFDETTGTAFVGDTAGMRVHGTPYILPVTPPPDVDLERWHASLNRIADWKPERLFVTHFGPSAEVGEHLQAMHDGLEEFRRLVRESLDLDLPDADRAQWFKQAVLAEAPAGLTEEQRAPYREFGQLIPGWHGVARYLRIRHPELHGHDAD